MITAIELQVISRILTSENEAEVDKLCAFDSSYYDTFKPQIEFILNYRSKYGSVPSLFNFQMEFEEEKINLVDVTEPLEFLITELKKNKQAIIFREMFNRVKDQGSADISEVWQYIGQQCDKADMLNDVQPMDIVAQAEERSIQVIEWSQQPRIPTGFPELDKLTYGGLSTVEEMLVIVARTNTGKAQPLYSKVLTPNGFISMRDVHIGTEVVTGFGNLAHVVGIFPQGVRPIYELELVDHKVTKTIRVADCHLNVVHIEGTRQIVETTKLLEYWNRGYDIRLPIYVNGTEVFYPLTDLKYVGKDECQCIMLDHSDHTYISDNYVVTHNTWILVKMMEAAQKAGFPVAYYSPEMQAAYLATRFDTWRGHYQNSDLFRGKYTAEYLNYIHKLPEGATPAFIIEDKDMVDGVSPKHLETFVKEHKIKLLIIDGISYMVDDKKSFSDHEKYAHICHDLFQLSKKYGCAIVIAAQANRETKECKDDKGMPFPNIYNIAGSDAIGQIATQVYAVRQIFDKHVLDIRLEKARMAPNENNVLSYSWDVNSGNMQYLPGGADEDPMTSMPSMPESPNIISNPMEPDNSGLNLTDDDDIEF